MLQVIREQADLVHLDFFIDSIKGFLEKAGASEQAVFDIILTAEEILVNVMSYAYPEDKKGFVEVSCEMAEIDGTKKLKFTFTDEGKFFDMLDRDAPDLSAPIEDRGIGGLGIHLVKTLMDEVSYLRKDNQNILTVLKNI